MKIVYFYQYFGTPGGAWSTRVYEMARRWVDEGHEVTVVTSVYDKSDLRVSGLVERLDIEGIDVRAINVELSNKHGYLRRIWTFLLFSLLSCWYALTLRADVVVASSGPMTIGLPGLVARYVRGRRFVFEVRDLWPEGAIQIGALRGRWPIALARAFERRCYRAAESVIALSEGQAEWIRRDHPDVRVHVVPNASDNELIDSLTPADIPGSEGRIAVVYTGTLGRMDDCRQIVEVGRVLRDRGIDDIELVLIGDGGERAELEALAGQYELDNVRFLGLKPKREALAMLRGARCSVITFRNISVMGTASPNKLFDAFAAGTPVVQTTGDWIERLLTRERAGLSAPPDDPDAFADAILRVVRDDDLHREFSENGKRLAREMFDRGLLSDRMLAILKGAVEPESASSSVERRTSLAPTPRVRETVG